MIKQAYFCQWNRNDVTQFFIYKADTNGEAPAPSNKQATKIEVEDERKKEIENNSWSGSMKIVIYIQFIHVELR